MGTLCLGCIACEAINGLGISGHGFGKAGALSDKKADVKDPLHDLILKVNKYVQKCTHICMYLLKRK